MSVHFQTSCETCHQEITPKKNEAGVCHLCESGICKKCSHFVEESNYDFLKSIPDALKTGHVCDSCFQSEVQPLDIEYEETMAKAKEVFVFFTTQRKEIPLIRKEKELFRIPVCRDRDETILRMAFFSAEMGMNALMDVQVESRKVRNEAYQTSEWTGVGRAAMVDQEKLERQYLRNQIYR